MLLKVPIYVEFDSVSPEDVPEIVASLQFQFYHILSKDKLSYLVTESKAPNRVPIPKYKIISREKALKYLREKA